MNHDFVYKIPRRLGALVPVLAHAEINRAGDLFTTRAGKRRWVVDNRRKTEGKS